MDKTFQQDTENLYKQLFKLGDRARAIISNFVRTHGGNYAIDTEFSDPVWLNEEVHVTELIQDSKGKTLVVTSGFYSIDLYEINDYNLLDLANYLNDMEA